MNETQHVHDHAVATSTHSELPGSGAPLFVSYTEAIPSSMKVQERDIGLVEDLPGRSVSDTIAAVFSHPIAQHLNAVMLLFSPDPEPAPWLYPAVRAYSPEL